MADKVLILSGGGAKGAYQAGVIRQLADKGWIPDAVAGVSVGALNGAMVATGRIDKMEEVWNEITPSKVLKKNSPARTVANFLLYKIGIISPVTGYYDNKPLQNLLASSLGSSFSCDYSCGTVNLHNGMYIDHVYYKDYVIAGRSKDELCKKIIASTAIPVVFSPVRIGSAMHADGGVRRMSPIGRILQKYEPTEIVIVTCSRRKKPINGPVKDIVQIARKSLEVMLAEIFDKDIREFERVNYLVRQAQEKGVELVKSNGEPYKEYTAKLYSPREDIGNSLDFSNAQARKSYRIGLSAGYEKL